MGGSSSKESKPLYQPPAPKQGEIKINAENLVKLNMVDLGVPKPPAVKTGADIRREAQDAELRSLIAFDLDKEFDQETFTGRFQMQASRLNPLNFFHTDKQITEAHKKVVSYRARLEAAKHMGEQAVMMKAEDIEEVKKASRVAGGAVHPDTNEIIPFYQRLSGFVVFNAPIVLAVMFTPNQTPAFNAFMQWVNQTYNCGMNYGNRNASSQYTATDLARGYSAAVVTSCGIALISRTLMAKTLSSLSGPRLMLTNAFLNWIAAALAGVANCTLMRQKEIFEGISVYNEDGSVCYGKSKEAGKQALVLTGFSRFVLPFPVLWGPALINIALLKAGLWPRNTTAAKFVELGLCISALSIALPGSVALFKQQSMLTREQIDPELRDTKLTKSAADSEVVKLDIDLMATPVDPSKKTAAAKKPEANVVEEKKEDMKEEFVQQFFFNKGL